MDFINTQQPLNYGQLAHLFTGNPTMSPAEVDSQMMFNAPQGRSFLNEQAANMGISDPVTHFATLQNQRKMAEFQAAQTARNNALQASQVNPYQVAMQQFPLPPVGTAPSISPLAAQEAARLGITPQEFYMKQRLQGAQNFDIAGQGKTLGLKRYTPEELYAHPDFNQLMQSDFGHANRAFQGETGLDLAAYHKARMDESAKIRDLKVMAAAQRPIDTAKQINTANTALAIDQSQLSTRQDMARSDAMSKNETTNAITLQNANSAALQVEEAAKRHAANVDRLTASRGLRYNPKVGMEWHPIVTPPPNATSLTGDAQRPYIDISKYEPVDAATMEELKMGAPTDWNAKMAASDKFKQDEFNNRTDLAKSGILSQPFNTNANSFGTGDGIFATIKNNIPDRWTPFTSGNAADAGTNPNHVTNFLNTPEKVARFRSLPLETQQRLIIAIQHGGLTPQN